MKRIMIGAATIAGASTLALTMLAAPAFASVPLTADAASTTSIAAVAATPTETLTKNVTVHELISSGVTAKFTGLTPGAVYDISYSTGQSGGLINDDGYTATAEGTVSGTWTATDPGKGNYRNEIGDGYTMSLFSTTGDSSTALVSKTFSVKYGSKLAWSPAHRTDGTVTLKVTAHRWSPSAAKNVVWKRVEVQFQEKVGSKWKTVKTAKTSSKGIAKATISAAEKHTWRATIATTATVWTATTGRHKK